jgi:hypothetical protein
MYAVWKRHTLCRFINGNAMDIHTRIAAALHIVNGALGASTMLIFALGAN